MERDYKTSRHRSRPTIEEELVRMKQAYDELSARVEAHRKRERSLDRDSHSPSLERTSSANGESSYSSGTPSAIDDYSDYTEEDFERQLNKRRKKEKTPPLAPDLGSSRKKEEALAPPIRSDLAKLWAEIADTGLEVLERDALIEKLPRIENCPFLKPPELNKEVARAIGPVFTRRDGRLSRKQTQIASALSGVAKLLSVFLEANEKQDSEYLATLGMVSQLLLDSFHEETCIRRALVGQTMNETTAEALQGTPVTEWLFGPDVLESIRVSKALAKSADELKTQKRNARRPPPPPPKNGPAPPRYLSAFRSTGRGGSSYRVPKRNRVSFPKTRQEGRSGSNYRARSPVAPYRYRSPPPYRPRYNNSGQSKRR